MQSTSEWMQWVSGERTEWLLLCGDRFKEVSQLNGLNNARNGPNWAFGFWPGSDGTRVTSKSFPFNQLARDYFIDFC